MNTWQGSHRRRRPLGARPPTYSPYVPGFRVGAVDPAVSCLCVGLAWNLPWKSRQWAADSTDQVRPGRTVGVGHAGPTSRSTCRSGPHTAQVRLTEHFCSSPEDCDHLLSWCSNPSSLCFLYHLGLSLCTAFHSLPFDLPTFVGLGE